MNNEYKSIVERQKEEEQKLIERLRNSIEIAEAEGDYELAERRTSILNFMLNG